MIFYNYLYYFINSTSTFEFYATKNFISIGFSEDVKCVPIYIFKPPHPILPSPLFAYSKLFQRSWLNVSELISHF